MNFKALALAGAALCIAAPAFAHHSFAMFDREKNITMSGVVTEFEWTNPHVWIHMKAPDQSGKDVVWSFEMQAIAQDSSLGADGKRLGGPVRPPGQAPQARQ